MKEKCAAVIRPVFLSALICVICGLGAAAAAQSVSLAWDASASPSVTNYVLYASSGTNSARLEVGTNLTASISNIVAGDWSVYVTAMASNRIESLPSANLLFTVPQPPARLRTVVVQYSGVITNFYDVGFFRLKLP